jgi:hypothetical protein
VRFSGEFNSHELIRALETSWNAFVVREVIFYWSGGIPALHVKLRTEQTSRKQIGVDAPYAVTRHLGEKIGFAVFAPGAGAGFQGEGVSLTALDGDRRGRVQAAGVSLPVYGLAVIAVTEILHQGLAGELYLHGPA